ncbi:MAG: PilZ domain-containing protein, partial [Armatimonadota bacterium]|nr:PilZ domain-containing protein [Armatimonadota bacterium]
MSGHDAPSIPAAQASLERLVRQMHARGWQSQEEADALLQQVRAARHTHDLVPVARRLAPFVKRLWVPPDHERRVSPRRAHSLLLRVLEDGSHGIHFIRDIGMGGVSLFIQAPLPLFPVLHCQLPLYHLGRVYHFTARVAWCQPNPPSVAGLEFVEMGEDLKEWLQTL